MDFNILPSQVVKTKTYCPNPIVKHGIPKYADSIANPKAIDTLAYQQYWEEQLYFIKNGYQAGGLYIPGRYYKFVNFDPAQTVKGVGPMELHDYQLDFAFWVDHLKGVNWVDPFNTDKWEFCASKNAYVPKARRKAMSVMTAGMVIDYGFRFSDNYHAAIVAGLQEYSDDFAAKWRYIDMYMIKEFRVRKMKNNDDEIIAGWKEKTEEGGFQDCGTQNTIYIKTVNNNANVLKGKFLNDIVFEESGENELLLETIDASKDCIQMGNAQHGNYWAYGTGGNMSTGSKGFKHINFNLDLYNAERFYIPAYVFYEPTYSGAVNKNGILVEDIPNLLHMEPYERVGWSDYDQAKKLIKVRKDQLLAAGDMEKYTEFCKNNPVTIEEIFRSSSVNNFDQIKINDQMYKINSSDKKYNKWHLSFKKNPETGEQVFPYQIEIRPATNNDNEHDCVYILNNGHPVKGYRHLDVAGIDSYDQNQAKHSKSLGSMVVFRRQHGISGIEDTSYAPVAMIRNRPKYKEQFYDLCIKLAIYYNLERSVLVDIAANMVSKHFEDFGYGHYLAFRPRKFESPNTKQTHDTGVSLNTYSKPKMVAALQSLFDFHCEKIWFDVILTEALNYDENDSRAAGVDSDNDAVDALGIAMMCAMDMDTVPVNEEDEDKDDRFNYPSYKVDGSGRTVLDDKSDDDMFNYGDLNRPSSDDYLYGNM